METSSRPLASLAVDAIRWPAEEAVMRRVAAGASSRRARLPTGRHRGAAPRAGGLPLHPRRHEGGGRELLHLPSQPQEARTGHQDDRHRKAAQGGISHRDDPAALPLRGYGEAPQALQSRGERLGVRQAEHHARRPDGDRPDGQGRGGEPLWLGARTATRTWRPPTTSCASSSRGPAASASPTKTWRSSSRSIRAAPRADLAGPGQPRTVSFNPRIPATMSAMHAIRGMVAGSLKSRMPATAVPTAPMPVQIA